ncbi:MAG: hypothetical protein EA423_00050 [Phycisphaerales bacterium]|nr:MAG: hypothetical protein EA423_00050 [Phycisphaerales bacterium]
MANGTAAAGLRDAGALGPALLGRPDRATVDPDLERWVEAELLPGERAIWAARADNAVLLLSASVMAGLVLAGAFSLFGLWLSHQAHARFANTWGLGPTYAQPVISLAIVFVLFFAGRSLLAWTQACGGWGRRYALTDRRLLIAKGRRTRQIERGDVLEIARSRVCGFAWSVSLYGRDTGPDRAMIELETIAPTGLDRELERALIVAWGLPRVGENGELHETRRDEAQAPESFWNDPARLSERRLEPIMDELVEGERLLMAWSPRRLIPQAAERAFGVLSFAAFFALLAVSAVVAVVATIESAAHLGWLNFIGVVAPATPSASWLLAMGDWAALIWMSPPMLFGALGLSGRMGGVQFSAVTDRRCIGASSEVVRSYGEASIRKARIRKRFRLTGSIRFRRDTGTLIGMPDTAPSVKLRDPDAARAFMRSGFLGEDEKNRPG